MSIIEGGRLYVRESRAAIEQLRLLLGLGQAHQIQIRPIAGTAEVA